MTYQKSIFTLTSKSVFFLLFLILACERKKNSKDFITEHLIIIGVDAMSPNGIINADTPVMDELMANGSYTLNARGVLPTSSSTNWASMVSGAGPEQHGVTSNGWERDEHTLPAVIQGEEGIFPTIFSVARNQRPDMEMGAIYTWGGFGRLIERSLLDYDNTEKNDELTVEKAIDYIKKKTPNFLFIHLDRVDHVGHSMGHKTPQFYDAVTKIDLQIGQIIQSTKEAGIYQNTTFIISADHGGIGFGHGGETEDEIEIPFIIFGKGIKRNYLIRNQVYTYDNAATAALLLGLDQPQAWTGRPIKTAFIGIAEPKFQNQKINIPAPTIYPKANLYDLAGGLYVDQEAEVVMESIGDQDIRYTIDGSIPTINSELYKGKFSLTETAIVMAKAFKGANQESKVSKAYFRMINSLSNNGIRYNYYESKKDMNFLPNFEQMKPVKSGNTYQFRIDSINQVKHQFGIEFTASIKIEVSGRYHFYLLSDDGSRLYINDTLIVDNDGGHGAIERKGIISLQPGLHKITLDYHNQQGGAWLDAFYKGPGIHKQIIPPNILFLNK
tara:strand:- start:3173 stop:4837 length:1665 start_codon:yes stop_codon:yes gene_type:complete